MVGVCGSSVEDREPQTVASRWVTDCLHGSMPSYPPRFRCSPGSDQPLRRRQALIGRAQRTASTSGSAQTPKVGCCGHHRRYPVRFTTCESPHPHHLASGDQIRDGLLRRHRRPGAPAPNIAGPFRRRPKRRLSRTRRPSTATALVTGAPGQRAKTTLKTWHIPTKLRYHYTARPTRHREYSTMQSRQLVRTGCGTDRTGWSKSPSDHFGESAGHEHVLIPWRSCPSGLYTFDSRRSSIRRNNFIIVANLSRN